MAKTKAFGVFITSSIVLLSASLCSAPLLVGCSSQTGSNKTESLPYADTVENRKKANKIYEQYEDLKRERKYDEAIKVIDEIAKYYPGEAPKLRADLDFAQGKYAEADKKMDEALKLDPDNYAYWEYASMYAFKNGDENKAIARATTAIEKKGENGSPSTAYLVRAMALRKKGQYAKALEDLDACLKITPSEVEAFYVKGVCLDEEGKPKEALAAFDEALRWSPTLQSAIKRRLAIFMRLKDRTGARQELARSAQQAKVKLMTAAMDWIPTDLSTAQVQAIEKNPKAE